MHPWASKSSRPRVGGDFLAAGVAAGEHGCCARPTARGALLASPADAAKRLAELSVTADFWRAVARSAAHILGGFLLSCALAVVLAALAARRAAWRSCWRRSSRPSRPCPVASFIILALVWLSSRSLTLFISALMVFPPVYLSTLEGIRPHRQAASRDGAGLPRAAFAAAGGDLCAAGAAYFRSAVSAALGLCWKAGTAAEVTA